MRIFSSIIIWVICGTFAASSLLSCSPFTSPDRSASHKDLPATFSLGEAVAATEQRWWFVFSSPQLNTLIEDALAENLSLHAHWARLEKIQAQAGKVASGLSPSVSAAGSASHTKIRTDGEGSGESLESNNYSLGLFASYELDLWGRVRAGVKSADLAVNASREDLNAAAMTIAAEVARRWIGILARQQELLLLQQQLANNQTYLELVELRFRKSLASALDVMQQQQLVERVQARIPLSQMEEQLLHNELAVLTGRMPSDLPDIERQSLPVMEIPPVTGIPAQLLDNRPDILAALNRLEAADQNLVVAKADRLPAIRLTGSAAYNSSEVDRIFDNWLLNLAASLTAPLIDGGRRKAEVDATMAGVKEQLAIYHQTVLTAVQEVEGALVREKKIREHIKATKKQLLAAQTALSEAGARYMNGLNDYLPVLTQLLSVQNLEMDLIARNEDLLTARISLYRGIGGTWTDHLPPPETSALKQQDGKL
jgi:NodT family efflux transporter outer membrane factor (OMF) lipoprotein